MKWTDHFVGFLDDVERAALSLVARVGPWAAPIAPAYFIARAAARHLSAPVAVAWAMGVAVEAVGIAAFIATLRAFTWNQERRTHDAPAPVLLGLLLIVVYLGVGIGLAVIVEVFPPIIPWAPAAFFVLAGVAYLVLGMMSDQARRERQANERGQHDQAMRAFRAAVRERGLGKAEGEAMLVQAGDPWTALDMLALASTKLAVPGPEQKEQRSATVKCPQCDRQFATVQALNAHGRWCPGNRNGKEPAVRQEEHLTR